MFRVLLLAQLISWQQQTSSNAPKADKRASDEKKVAELKLKLDALNTEYNARRQKYFADVNAHDERVTKQREYTKNIEKISITIEGLQEQLEILSVANMTDVESHLQKELSFLNGLLEQLSENNKGQDWQKAEWQE